MPIVRTESLPVCGWRWSVRCGPRLVGDPCDLCEARDKLHEGARHFREIALEGPYLPAAVLHERWIEPMRRVSGAHFREYPHHVRPNGVEESGGYRLAQRIRTIQRPAPTRPPVRIDRATPAGHTVSAPE